MNNEFESMSQISGPLTVFRHAAMASDFEISFNEDLSDIGAASALDVFDEVDRIENILTVFKTSSLVSRINALAAEMPFRVSAEVFDWLMLCRQLSEVTEGAFDITCSPLWKVWGFARRQGAVPGEKELEQAKEKVGWRHLILDETEKTVKFDLPGVEISFGSIGKGIALDQAAAFLDRAGLSDYLFQGGQSSAVVKGGRKGEFRLRKELLSGRDQSEETRKKGSKICSLPSGERVRQIAVPCWSVGVSHPLRPERRLAELRLANQALGTSGSQYQFFRYRGKRYAHIIDPRSGDAVSGILSAIVVAPNARLADALSTAFFIFGPDKTEKWCKNHKEIAALLLLERKGEPSLEMAAFNMNDEIFRTL